MAKDITSNPNRFRPSSELTERLTHAVTSGKRISEKAAHLVAKVACIEGYHASWGQVGVDPQEYFGEGVEMLTATMAYRAGGRHEDSIRVGENGQFSYQFLQMLPDRIPVKRGNAKGLYSKLFNEYYQHTQNTEPTQRAWGRLVADETGLSVVDISPIVRKPSTRPRAIAVGGITIDRSPKHPS